MYRKIIIAILFMVMSLKRTDYINYRTSIKWNTIEALKRKTAALNHMRNNFQDVSAKVRCRIVSYNVLLKNNVYSH